MDKLFELARKIKEDLEESADFPPSVDYPGEINSDWPQHCSVDRGCDDCEYSYPDCPGS